MPARASGVAAGSFGRDHSSVRLAAITNTGRYADPLLNTAGPNRILNGGSPNTDVGASEVYLQAQQMVYRPDGSDRRVTLFGGANWATSGELDIEKIVLAGAYYEGLFAERPNDTLGVLSTLPDPTPTTSTPPRF